MLQRAAKAALSRYGHDPPGRGERRRGRRRIRERVFALERIPQDFESHIGARRIIGRVRDVANDRSDRPLEGIPISRRPAGGDQVVGGRQSPLDLAAERGQVCAAVDSSLYLSVSDSETSR